MYKRGEDTGPTAMPRTGETDWWIQTAAAYRNRLTSGNRHGNQNGENLNCDFDTLLEAQHRQLWELTPRWLLYKGLLQNCETWPKPHNKYQEKNPLILLAGGEQKEPFWNTAEHCVLHQACLQKKLVHQSLIRLGVIRAWLTLGKGNTQL